MARGACVIGWDTDNAVKGQQKLTAVTCREKIELLEELVYKLALDLPLTLRENLAIEEVIEKAES